jgi:hypothetical protein
MTVVSISRQRKEAGNVSTLPADMAGCGDLGQGGSRGVAAQGELEKEKLPHSSVLEAAALPHHRAQVSAAFQITRHCLNQYLDCFAVLGPLQLLLARQKMLQCISQP